MEILCIFPTAPCLLNCLFILTLHLFMSFLSPGKWGLWWAGQRIMQPLAAVAQLFSISSLHFIHFPLAIGQSLCLIRHPSWFLRSQRFMFSNLLQSKVSKASHHFCVYVLEEKIIFLKKTFYKTFFFLFQDQGICMMAKTFPNFLRNFQFI